MDIKRKYNLSVGDSLALGIALLISLVIWFTQTIGREYSTIVQSSVRVVTSIDSHSDKSEENLQIAARCKMPGSHILYFRLNKDSVPLRLSPEDIHHSGGDLYFITPASLSKYFYDIFGSAAKLEYFVTDTLYFHLAEVKGKKVKVNVVSNIKYKPQYMSVGELKVAPDSVMIYGEESDLAIVERVNTMLINHYEVSEDVFGEVGFEQIDGIRIGSERASYSLRVSRYAEIEQEVPVTASNVPFGIKFMTVPSTAVVKIKMIYPGPSSISDLKLVIPYEDFVASKSGRCVPRVEGLNDYVLGYSLEPEVFDCVVVMR